MRLMLTCPTCGRETFSGLDIAPWPSSASSFTNCSSTCQHCDGVVPFDTEDLHPFPLPRRRWWLRAHARFVRRQAS